jgi:hypothetical protein
MNRDFYHILFSVVVFVPIVLLAIFSYPSKSEALSIFSPFGGKVISWTPEAPGCSALTAAVSAATLGSVNITVEQLIVGPPKGGTFGILRINGVIPPLLTTVYKNKLYEVPNTWVLGNYLNLCNVCGAVEDIPIVKEICKIPGIKDILDSFVFQEICKAVGHACPISKLIHKIGTGGLGF